MGTVLLVARSLAVYGGTAAALLFLAHRFVVPLPRRTALLLAAAPLLFTGRALLTGCVYGPIDILYNGYPFGSLRVEHAVPPDRTPLLGDVVYQSLPWRAAVRRAIFEGRLPLWNPHTLAGEPLTALAQPAVLHPGTLLGLLLPLPQAWTFDMSLRLLIALLAAFLFARDLGCGERASLVAALGWAFSNWMVFYLGLQPMSAAAPLPLLLLGLRRIAREPGVRGAAIAVAAILLVAAAGHPETLLHTSAGAALFFLWELARARPGRRLASLRIAVTAVVVAAGLSAVILLPILEALPHTLEHFVRTTWYAHQPRSRSGEEIVTRLAAQVVPYSVGVSGHGRLMDGFIEPSAYAGALLFPFALSGVFARARERWFFLLAGLFGLAVWIKTPMADAIAKLPLFDIALNERLLLWTVLSLCVLAALGANRLAHGEGAPAFLVGCAGTLGLVAWLYVRFRPRFAALEMPAEFLRGRLLAQLVPLLLGLILVAFLPRRLRATVGLSVLVVIFAAARVFEQGGTYPTMARSTFYPRFDVLEAIPGDPAYRMAGVGRALIPNASAVYGLDDVRGYEAMTLRRFHDTYPLWCVAQPVWFNRIDDPTRPFLSFLAARWVLTETGFEAPIGWPKRAEGAGLVLLENPRALPRVFAPRFTRSEPDPGRRIELLGGIADFGERGVVEDGPASDWTPNAPSRVTIVEARADRLEIETRADAPGPRRGVDSGLARLEGRDRRRGGADDSLQPRLPRRARPGRNPPADAAIPSERLRLRRRGERRDARRVARPAPAPTAVRVERREPRGEDERRESRLRNPRRGPADPDRGVFPVVQVVEDQKGEKAGTERECGQEPAGRGAGRDEQDERQQPRESERPGLEGERQPREHGPEVLEMEREESAVAAESRAEAEVVLEEKPRRERGGRRKRQAGRPAEKGGPPLEDVARGDAEDDQDRAHRSLDLGQNGTGEHPRRHEPARCRVLGQERRDGDGLEEKQRRLGVGARERGRHGGRHGRDPERGDGRCRVGVEPAPQKAAEQRRGGRDPEERGQGHGAPGELPGREGAERLDDRDERADSRSRHARRRATAEAQHRHRGRRRSVPP